jgi:putative Holliday junction resolvase
MSGIMALDVGSKRIGVAVADPSGTYALPVGTIERASLRADLESIARYAKDYAVTELVVGDPVALSGERGIASKNMDEFVARVRSVFQGRIHRIDERLTTAQATKAMVTGGIARKQRKRNVDMMAAALILEAYLATRAKQ